MTRMHVSFKRLPDADCDVPVITLRNWKADLGPCNHWCNFR